MSAAVPGGASCLRRLRGLPLGLLLAAAVAACAAPAADRTAGEAPREVQRATRGPTAEEVFLARFAQHYGRLPTFDEHLAWKEDTEARILRHLAQRPELASAPRASQLRFQRMVMVGMQKEDVLVLLDRPDVRTEDAAAMRAAAGRFWEPIGRRAREMWTYPVAWALYFDGDVLVDVTVADGRALR